MSRDELKSFAMRVYAEPGVEACCLELQDSHGLNVNLILLALWLGSTGKGVAGERLWRTVVDETTRWDADAVRPLRAVRRRLRASASEDGGVDALRRCVAECELAAEYLLLDRLEGRFEAAAVANLHGRHTAEDAASNLWAYVNAAGRALPSSAVGLLANLLTAVFPALGADEGLELLRLPTDP